MVILLSILTLLLTVVLWLLLAPLIISIDSQQEIIALKWKSIGGINGYIEEEHIILRYNVLFYKKETKINWIRLLDNQLSKKDKPKKSKQKKKNKKKKPIDWRKKISRVLSSFELKKCWINLDTNNYCFNAYLFPIFHIIRGQNYAMQVNFNGKNEVVLHVKNRLIKLIIAVLF